MHVIKRAFAKYPPSLVQEGAQKLVVGEWMVDILAARDKDPNAYLSGETFLDENGPKIGVVLKSDFSDHDVVRGSILSEGTIHHEMAHNIARSISEVEWRKIHPDAQYLGNRWSTVTPKILPKGFTSPYSLNGYDDDIAEIIERLLSASRVIKEQAQADSILTEKIKFLKTLYEKKSNGKMDAAYWTDLEHGKISEAYWDKR